MKTLKIALIAALVACTIASLANAGKYTDKPDVMGLKFITLEKAMQIPGLASAIYQQVNLDEILKNPSNVCTVTVKYRGVYYRISGTKEEWLRYFWRKRIPPVLPPLGL